MTGAASGGAGVRCRKSTVPPSACGVKTASLAAAIARPAGASTTAPDGALGAGAGVAAIGDGRRRSSWRSAVAGVVVGSSMICPGIGAAAGGGCAIAASGTGGAGAGGAGAGGRAAALRRPARPARLRGTSACRGTARAPPEARRSPSSAPSRCRASAARRPRRSSAEHRGRPPRAAGAWSRRGAWDAVPRRPARRGAACSPRRFLETPQLVEPATPLAVLEVEHGVTRPVQSVRELGHLRVQLVRRWPCHLPAGPS